MQDILYFADRASFPYGTKTPSELLALVRSATEYLSAEGCVAVVLASNAPSVMVRDLLRAAVAIPVIGIFPPIREAIERSKSKHVAVLGVRSMIVSEAMQTYAKNNSLRESRVLLVNASPLVNLVENFTFLNDPSSTQEIVTQFITDVLQAAPALDVMTMSSTHLPWLKQYFQSAAPDVLFLDPADAVIDELRPYTSVAQGQTRFVATETAELSLEQFNAALRSLGVAQQAKLRIQG
jgi:glutamate racemase